MGLYDGKKEHPCKRGLVDDNGAFFLLLESNSTRYLRFSSQAEAVTALMGENEKLNDRVAFLAEQLEKARKRREKTQACGYQMIEDDEVRYEEMQAG